jgi:hypothetical protein
MPEVTITYKKPETLKILKGLAKYFDFKISSKKDQPYKIKGVTILPATEEFDNSDLSDIFKDVDAAKLRKEAWQRKQ